MDDSPKDSPQARAKLLASLADCMTMNSLSAEALLARFFNADMLRTYCEHRLGVSGKGNEATLAARIARVWSKPNFEPLTLNKKADECKDMQKKRSSTKEGSAKKPTAEEEEQRVDKMKKKHKIWSPAMQNPSFTVTAPPGPLGLTIKQYSDDFIVKDVSPTCAIPEAQGKFARVREGNIIVSINGNKIKSEGDAILKDSNESRVIVIAGDTITMNAADLSKGKLLHMKESGNHLFRIMDYSDVAQKYGDDFLEELSPPNKGKSGRQIQAEACATH
jgi:hypothetical protein